MGGIATVVFQIVNEGDILLEGDRARSDRLPLRVDRRLE
jgi:hypothetical protein